MWFVLQSVWLDKAAALELVVMQCSLCFESFAKCMPLSLLCEVALDDRSSHSLRECITRGRKKLLSHC